MKRKLVIYVKVKTNATDYLSPWASSHYKELLKTVSGKWIKVDTKYLFENQLNLVEFSKDKCGLRLLNESIFCVVICNGTLKDVKKQINGFYNKNWNRDVNEAVFKAFWERWHDLGLYYKPKIMAHNHNKRIIEL